MSGCTADYRKKFGVALKTNMVNQSINWSHRATAFGGRLGRGWRVPAIARRLASARIFQ